MRHFDCNSTVVTGYSAFCYGGAVLRFYSHTSTDTMNIYEDSPSEDQLDEGVWIHFPVSKGESITSIIRRNPRGVVGGPAFPAGYHDLGLIVSMSQCLGTYLDPLPRGTCT